MQLQIALQLQFASGQRAVNGTSLASSSFVCAVFSDFEILPWPSSRNMQQEQCNVCRSSVQCSTWLKLELNHCTFDILKIKQIKTWLLWYELPGRSAEKAPVCQLSFDAVLWNWFAAARPTCKIPLFSINIFCNLDKYTLQFGQIHLAI